MSRFLNSILGLSLVAATTPYSTIAFADSSSHANSTCSCVSEANAATGKITQVSGQVLLADSKGYILATEGASLNVGSSVSVGAQSQAKVSFGSACSLNVTANSDLSVIRTDNAAAPICLNVKSTRLQEVKAEKSEALASSADPEVITSPEVIEEAEEKFGGGLLIIGGLVIAGGIAGAVVALTDDDDDLAGDDPATPAAIR